MMLLFGSFISIAEKGVFNPSKQQYIREDGKPSPFSSIPQAMYWCMTTMTTVGYGDLFPISYLGQAVGILSVLTGCDGDPPHASHTTHSPNTSTAAAPHQHHARF